jgi:hypothetical protein
MITDMAKQQAAKLRRARRPAPVERRDGDIGFETISVSVPREIVRVVRAKAGKRGFSRFVARAMARELTQQYREEYVKAAERIHGPLTEVEILEGLALLDA